MKHKNIKVLMFLSLLIIFCAGITSINAADANNATLHENTQINIEESAQNTNNQIIESNTNTNHHENLKTEKSTTNKIQKQESKVKTEPSADDEKEFGYMLNPTNYENDTKVDYTISNNNQKSVTLSGTRNIYGFPVNLIIKLTNNKNTITIDKNTNSFYANAGDTITIDNSQSSAMLGSIRSQTALVLSTNKETYFYEYLVNDHSTSYTIPTSGNYVFLFTGATMGRTTIGLEQPEIWYGTLAYYIPDTPTPTPTEVTLAANDVTIKNGETKAITINTNPNINQGTVTVTDANSNTIATVNLANSNTFNYQANGMPGTQITLTYNYEDTTNTYTASSTTSKVTITKRNSITSSQPVSTNVGDVKVKVTVLDEDGSTPITNGTVNILNGNTVIGTASLSGSNTVEIPLGLAAGKYNLVANYTGNNYHITSKDENGLKDLTVNSNAVTITAPNKESKFGTTVNIEITTAPNVNQGIVTVTDNNGFTQNIDLAQSNSFDYPVNGEPGNEITLTYTYNDATSTYTSEGTTSKVTITKHDSITSSQPVSTNVGDVKVKVTVLDEDGSTPITNGTVNILNGNTVIATATLEGSNTIEIPLDLAAGKYNLVANYTGNNYHITSKDENGLKDLTINENSVKPVVTIKANDIYAGEFVNISGTISVDNDYDLDGTLINLTITTSKGDVINDYAIVEWDESESSYYYEFNEKTIEYETIVDVSAKYIRQTNLDEYNRDWMEPEELALIEDSDEATVSFNVIKVPLKFTTENVTTLVNNSVTALINLTVNAPIDLVENPNGRYPDKGTLTIYGPDGTELLSVRPTDIPYAPDVSKNGTFIYTVKYTDDSNQYENIETTFKVVVNNIKTTIDVTAEDIYIGQEVKISGKLTSDDNTVSVEDKEITLTINDISYVASTDSEGKFTFDQISMDKVTNDIQVTAKFNASQTLADSNIATDTFNVLALPTSISTESNTITTKINDENIVIPITLIDTVNNQLPASGKIVITKDNQPFTTLYLPADDLVFNPDVDTNGTFEYKIEYIDENGKYLSDNTIVTVVVNTIESKINVKANDIYVDQNVNITGSLTADGMDVTDKVIVITFGDKTYNTTTDEKGEFELNNITMISAENNIVVTAIFNKADGISTSNLAETSFNVKLIPVKVGAQGVTVNAKDDVQIPIDLTDLVNEVVPSQGTITVTLDGNVVATLSATDNPLEFTPDTSVPSTFTYTITFTDGIKYDTNTINITVTVNTIPTVITLDASDIYAGEYINITGTLTAQESPLVNQEVVITLKDKQYSVVTNATGQFILDNMTIDVAENNIPVSAVFNENLPYITSNVAETSFDVKKIEVEIKAENKTTKVGNDVTISITLKDKNSDKLPTQGKIVITDKDGKTITLDVTKDNLEFTHNAVLNGEFNYTISFIDDANKYESNSTMSKVIVNKLKTTVTSENKTVLFGENVVIPIVVKDENGNVPTTGNVEVIRDNKSIITLDISKDILEFTHTSDANGEFVYTIKYSAANNYESSQTTQKVTVNNKEVTLRFIEVTDTTVGKTNSIKVELTDGNNKISNEFVTINIDGKNYVVKTDNNGIATVNTFKSKVERKDVKVVASYPGNDTTGYKEAKSIEDSFDVNKIDTIITIDPINDTIYSDNVTITGTLTTTNGDKLSKYSVVLNLDGLNYTVKTDNPGKYSFNVKTSSYNKNNATVSYKGDSKYNPSNNTSNFNVVKKATTITVDSINTNVYGNQLNITGKLVDSDNIPISNGTIVINVGKNNYTVHSDKNGNYILKINSTKLGVNNVSVKYLGDNKYITSNTSTNFNVSAIPTVLNVQVTDSNVGDPAEINVTLTDNNQKSITDKVNITINGKTKEYNISNGKLSIQYIPTSANPVNVTVSYNGNANKGYANTTNKFATINVDKHSTKVTVDSAKSIIGDKFTLVAHVVDGDGDPVNGGSLVFKVNGLTLREDGKFGSNAKPLKLSVVNGIVQYTLTADLYLRHAKNVTATYSGSSKYYANRTETFAPIEIALRNAAVQVTLNPSRAKQNQTITITTTISDVTPKSDNNKFLDSDDDYVFLKLNGKTFKDDEGNMIKINVTNGKAVYNYTLPRAMAGLVGTVDRNYTITAGFSSKNYYPDSRVNATFNVERSPINVTLTNATFKNQKLSIKGTIKDDLGLNVIGSNKVCIKINGLTYMVNNKTQYYTVKDGIVDLSLNLISSIKDVNQVQLVTGDRQAYLGNRSNVLDL